MQFHLKEADCPVLHIKFIIQMCTWIAEWKPVPQVVKMVLYQATLYLAREAVVGKLIRHNLKENMSNTNQVSNCSAEYFLF